MTRRTIGSDDLSNLSADQKILRSIWDKAGRENGLELPPIEKNVAYRTRFLLFAMAKALREQNLPRDQELNLQIRDLTVKMRNAEGLGGKVILYIEGKVPVELHSLAEALGLDSKKDDSEADASLEAIKRKLQEAGIAPGTVNPFYNRD